MKAHLNLLLAALVLGTLSTPALAQQGGNGNGNGGGGSEFVPPDADGDGIPNGQDADYVPPRDGGGKGFGNAGDGTCEPKGGGGFRQMRPAARPTSSRTQAQAAGSSN